MQLIRQPLLHLQVLLVVAVVLGGGGNTDGLHHMVIELAALLVLALNPCALGTFVRQAPRGLVILLTLSVALPLLQAVPLPPAVWHSLPGRELVVESYRASGIPTDHWLPFSLYPVRTLASFCATLVPATVIVIGWQMGGAQRVRLMQTVGILAAALLLLGAAQMASANREWIWLTFATKPDRLYATYANHNSTGLFFGLAALLTLALPLSREWWRVLLAGLAAALFVLAVVLTQSRSAITLLAVVAAFGLWRLVSHLRTSRRQTTPGPDQRHLGLLLGGIGLALVAVLAASQLSGGKVADAAARFSQLDRDRLEMWDDGAFVATRYWPLGAGTGTFDEVFQVDESLEYVSPRRAGRAHNDYVELVIELGLPGMVLLLAWLGWLALAWCRRWGAPDRWQAHVAMAGLVCVALQSVLDYPVRNHANLALIGLLLVLLLPAREEAA